MAASHIVSDRSHAKMIVTIHLLMYCRCWNATICDDECWHRWSWYTHKSLRCGYCIHPTNSLWSQFRHWAVDTNWSTRLLPNQCEWNDMIVPLYLMFQPQRHYPILSCNMCKYKCFRGQFGRSRRCFRSSIFGDYIQLNKLVCDYVTYLHQHTHITYIYTCTMLFAALTNKCVYKCKQRVTVPWQHETDDFEHDRKQ